MSFICIPMRMNLIKAHGGKSSGPFTLERLAASPPQADHVLVDLFFICGGWGGCVKAPPQHLQFLLCIIYFLQAVDYTFPAMLRADSHIHLETMKMAREGSWGHTNVSAMSFRGGLCTKCRHSEYRVSFLFSFLNPHPKEREKYWLVAFHTHLNQGLNLRPRCVPWLGIQRATFCCTCGLSNQLSPLATARESFLCQPRVSLGPRSLTYFLCVCNLDFWGK